MYINNNCIKVDSDFTINRGKVAFANSGTVLRYYIGQTFLATFRSNPDLLQAYNNWDTGQIQGTNNTSGDLFILNL